MGRATYFRHFSSKEDVLIFKLRYLWLKRLETEDFLLTSDHAKSL
ncbi:MAG: hypothetical protein J6O40_04825 [Ruminococcus sp.]|nr:hypothetical protein [Ruminococcus sp.]